MKKKLEIENKLIESFENIGFFLDKTMYDDFLDLDSLNYVQFLIELEVNFEIDIPIEDLKNINTFNDFLDYLKMREIECIRHL